MIDLFFFFKLIGSQGGQSLQLNTSNKKSLIIKFMFINENSYIILVLLVNYNTDSKYIFPVDPSVHT